MVPFYFENYSGIEEGNSLNIISITIGNSNIEIMFDTLENRNKFKSDFFTNAPSNTKWNLQEVGSIGVNLYRND